MPVALTAGTGSRHETLVGCSPPSLTCRYATIPTGTSALSEGGLPHSRRGLRHSPAGLFPRPVVYLRDGGSYRQERD